MRAFCRKYKIKYEKVLTKSTKNSLVWWGDSASKKWISGKMKILKLKLKKIIFIKEIYNI